MLFIILCFCICFLPSWQPRSTSLAGTPVQPLPACRAMKRLFTKLARRWASPASLATSCRAKPPSTASLGTRHSGTTPHPPAEVQHTSIATNVIIGSTQNFNCDSCATPALFKVLFILAASTTQYVDERKLDGKSVKLACVVDNTWIPENVNNQGGTLFIHLLRFGGWSGVGWACQCRRNIDKTGAG